jgi:serine/threonine-protein kinase
MTEREMFEAMLEQAPERRHAYLDGICGADAKLRRRLESLMKKNDLAASFLESPAAVLPPILEDSVCERPGTLVGPYKLMEQIGEGGMGLVFVAEQQNPVRRTVALKLIKPCMDSKQVIARFEAERQALAMMDHPPPRNWIWTSREQKKPRLTMKPRRRATLHPEDCFRMWKHSALTSWTKSSRT